MRPPESPSGRPSETYRGDVRGDGDPTDRSTVGTSALHAVGLTEKQAHARYRRQTALMVGLFVLSCLVVYRLASNEVVTELRLAYAPEYTATVEPPPFEEGRPVLHWVGADHRDRYGTLEAGDTYRLGERVRVQAYSRGTCWQWTTPGENADVYALTSVLVLFPAMAIIAYVRYRRRWWESVLEASRRRMVHGRVTGLVQRGGQTVLKVNTGCHTFYLPLLRDQFVSLLHSPTELRPLGNFSGYVIPSITGC